MRKTNWQDMQRTLVAVVPDGIFIFLAHSGQLTIMTWHLVETSLIEKMPRGA
jgi:hypothetical protein